MRPDQYPPSLQPQSVNVNVIKCIMGDTIRKDPSLWIKLVKNTVIKINVCLHFFPHGGFQGHYNCSLFISLHSTDRAFTVMVATAEHLLKRLRASRQLHSSPLMLHVGIHPLRMRPLLMHSCVQLHWQQQHCGEMTAALCWQTNWTAPRLTRQLTAISMHDWATTHFTASHYHCCKY